MHTDRRHWEGSTLLPLQQTSRVTAGCSGVPTWHGAAHGMLSLGYRYGTNHEWR